MWIKVLILIGVAYLLFSFLCFAVVLLFMIETMIIAKKKIEAEVQKDE